MDEKLEASFCVSSSGMIRRVKRLRSTFGRLMRFIIRSLGKIAQSRDRDIHINLSMRLTMIDTVISSKGNFCAIGSN